MLITDYSRHQHVHIPQVWSSKGNANDGNGGGILVSDKFVLAQIVKSQKERDSYLGFCGHDDRYSVIETISLSKSLSGNIFNDASSL